MLIETNYAELTTHLNTIDARLTKLETPAVVVPPKPKLQLGAVSYYGPGSRWDALLATKPAVVLINPASGPGLSSSASYASQVLKARAAGAKVFGYVWTGYGTRSIRDIIADAECYARWYAVDGIFLDEASNKAEQLMWYSDICKTIRGLDLRGMRVALNHGTVTLEGYVQAADYCMVFEGSALAHATRGIVSWELNYPGRLWHSIHSCGTYSMPDRVAGAYRMHGAGHVWVTDDVPTNPYDSNPSYLTALATEVARYV